MDTEYLFWNMRKQEPKGKKERSHRGQRGGGASSSPLSKRAERRPTPDITGHHSNRRKSIAWMGTSPPSPSGRREGRSRSILESRPEKPSQEAGVPKKRSEKGSLPRKRSQKKRMLSFNRSTKGCSGAPGGIQLFRISRGHERKSARGKKEEDHPSLSWRGEVDWSESRRSNRRKFFVNTGEKV